MPRVVVQIRFSSGRTQRGIKVSTVHTYIKSEVLSHMLYNLSITRTRTHAHMRTRTRAHFRAVLPSFRGSKVRAEPPDLPEVFT